MRILLCWAVPCLLILAGCRSFESTQTSPLDPALQARIARVQQAIDREFKTQRDLPDSKARDRRLGQLSEASGRVGTVEMMALGATVTSDRAALLRAEDELRRLEAELGIAE